MEAVARSRKPVSLRGSHGMLPETRAEWRRWLAINPDVDRAEARRLLRLVDDYGRATDPGTEIALAEAIRVGRRDLGLGL